MAIEDLTTTQVNALVGTRHDRAGFEYPASGLQPYYNWLIRTLNHLGESTVGLRVVEIDGNADAIGVTAGAIQMGNGDVLAYAGDVDSGGAIDGLTDDDTTYVWAEISAGAISISSAIDGTGWPSKPHVKLAEVTMASGVITSITQLSHAVRMPSVATHTATANPDADDDGVATGGNGAFEVNSLWLNTSTQKAYLCLDNSTGAAVWRQVQVLNASGELVAIIIPRNDTKDNIDGITLSDGEIALTTDTYELRLGDGVTAGGSAAGGVFGNYSGVVHLHTGHDSYDFVFGSVQLDEDGEADHNNRMFFDKSKSAFRAGLSASNSWDEANVGLYSAAFGAGSIASGAMSFATGNVPEASGSYSVAFGYATTASGQSSFASGESSTASGDNSTAIGLYAEASGTGAVALAQGLASAAYAVAFSQAEASGAYATGLGDRGLAANRNQVAQGGGKFTSNGDAQASRMVVRKQVTHSDTTWSSLALDGTSDLPAVPTDSTWCLTVRITGATSGMAKSLAFIIEAHVENDGGTLTIRSQTTTFTSDADDTSYDVQLAASGTDLAVQVSDSDGAGDTVRWVASIDSVELTYA